MRYITDGVRRTSKEKLYNELGFETLKKEDSTWNCVVFKRFSNTNVQSTYSILFPLLWVQKRHETITIFLYSE